MELNSNISYEVKKRKQEEKLVSEFEERRMRADELKMKKKILQLKVDSCLIIDRTRQTEETSG